MAIYDNDFMDDPDPKSNSAVIGETKIERTFDHYFGNAIHFFLSLLAVIVVVAAAIAAIDTVIYDVPKLWRQPDPYQILHNIIQNLLLVGIAAELGLLFLFHRTSAAVEVVVFVIARKLVTPELTAMDLLLGVVALVGLIAARYYFVKGTAKESKAEKRKPET